MAGERQGFPMIPIRAWWALRKRFRLTMPKEVTATYVASALDMTPRSADANVLPSLRQMGLIDADGKPSDLANRWRDDDEYAEVAETIRSEVYPRELLDLAPAGHADRNTVQSWFARHTGAGESAARKMAAVYMILIDADPGRAQGKKSGAGTPRKSRRTPSKKKKKKETGTKPDAQSDADNQDNEPRRPSLPQVAFNIQVVLPSDGSAETYDQIFASIAKHLLSGPTE